MFVALGPKGGNPPCPGQPRLSGSRQACVHLSGLNFKRRAKLHHFNWNCYQIGSRQSAHKTNRKSCPPKSLVAHVFTFKSVTRPTTQKQSTASVEGPIQLLKLLSIPLSHIFSPLTFDTTVNPPDLNAMLNWCPFFKATVRRIWHRIQNYTDINENCFFFKHGIPPPFSGSKGSSFLVRHWVFFSGFR